MKSEDSFGEMSDIFLRWWHFYGLLFIFIHTTGASFTYLEDD